MSQETLYTAAQIADKSSLTARQLYRYKKILIQNGHAVEKGGTLAGFRESAIPFLTEELKTADIKSGVQKRVRHIDRHINSLVDRLNKIDPHGKIFGEDDVTILHFSRISGWMDSREALPRDEF